VVTLWDEAPRDTDRVRAEFQGKVFEEATEGGTYMFTWWDVPFSTAQTIAFRTKGEWVRAPTIREQLEEVRRRTGLSGD
jgi:hypothetical protein